MDCSPPGSSVPGISQARILEWVAIFFSRRSSALAGRFFTTKPPGKPLSVHWSKIKSQRQSFGCSRKFSSVQFSSVAQSCPTLCNPMNHSTPGLPVHHQFPEFTQTHVHRVDDAVQLSHPLPSPSPAPNSSQHQGLFQ